MRLFWCLCLLSLMAVGLSSIYCRNRALMPCYVQLIWGTNDPQPELPPLRPVGSKLRTELSRVFDWQKYWEIKRERVDVPLGKTSSVRLSPDCEVRIRFASPGVRE